MASLAAPRPAFTVPEDLQAWRNARIAGLVGLVIGGFVLGPLALKFSRRAETLGRPCSLGRAAGIGAICVGASHLVLFLGFLAV